MAHSLARRPVAAAMLLTLAFIVVGVAVGLAAILLLPDARPDFVAVCVMAALVAIFLTVLGWWRAAGFNAPPEWRDLHLLWLPAIVAIGLPFLGGARGMAVGTFALLVVAYALTGFMEEAWSRGIILHLLRPTGVVRAIVLSAVLFAALHLQNVLYRNVFVVLSQMVGAFCFGLAYAALRVRTNTLWFLMPLHALHDLLLRFSRFPTIPLDVVQDIILLGYALWLIRRLGDDREREAQRPRADVPIGAPSMRRERAPGD
jgi:membrane protease YdiL (CAAX protease family)